MPRSEELPEALTRKNVEAYESGKGLKAISKIFTIHLFTERK